MTEYAIALFATLGIAAFYRPALGVALLVSYNFLLNETFVRLTDSYTPWLWFTLTDGLTATVLLLLGNWFGRTGAAVAAIYIVQTIMHLAFYLSGLGNPLIYWQSLTVLAFLQLSIIICGGIGGGGRAVRVCRRIFRMAKMGGAHGIRLAQWQKDE